MAVIGVNEYMGKRFQVLPFDGEWQASFGNPEKNFRALIYGAPGNGKTEFVVKLAKYLCGFTKVYYNSHEQKFSKSLQDALVRNNMREVVGKIIFADGEPFETMMTRLGKRNSPGACIIDSLDYMKLTEDQYVKLVEKFPHKIFIIISWASGSRPKKGAAEAIEYMVDIKILVKNFKAHMRSRFGGNEDFIIWDKKPTKAKKESAQLSLIPGENDAETTTISA